MALGTLKSGWSSKKTKMQIPLRSAHGSNSLSYDVQDIKIADIKIKGKVPGVEPAQS